MAAYFRIIRASFFPLRYGQWLGPLAAAALFIAAIATATIATGAIDLAADIPHPQAWAQLLHLTFKRSVGSQSAAIAPPADLMRLPIGKGAMMFDAVCANCHGTPGRGQSLVSLSMRPRPQYLPAVINQFNDAELFWIVKHGVKYSAMPAFPTQLRDDEVWTVVAFLRAVPTMDQAHYAALTATPAIAARQAPPAAGVTPHRTGFRLENNNAVPAMGFGGQRLGTDAATGCAACHGADGAHPRSGGIPVLGLLDPDSIRAALQAYADGTRHSGYMQPVAAQLSPAAIDALALQFGAHRPAAPAATPAPIDGALLARGRAIAQGGVPQKRTTACEACHAINTATQHYYPAIAGQDWRYLRDQLRLYRAGVRHAVSPLHPMVAQAHQLDDRDIDAVAAWYAALAPRAPAAVKTAPVRTIAGAPPQHRAGKEKHA